MSETTQPLGYDPEETILVECCEYRVKLSDHPVKFNPLNKVVQCHACGKIWLPEVLPPSLVYKINGEPVVVGQTVTLGGKPGKIIYFSKPHKPSSEGKVHILVDGDGFSREVYVSVIGAEWINRDDL